MVKKSDKKSKRGNNRFNSKGINKKSSVSKNRKRKKLIKSSINKTKMKDKKKMKYKGKINNGDKLKAKMRAPIIPLSPIDPIEPEPELEPEPEPELESEDNWLWNYLFPKGEIFHDKSNECPICLETYEQNDDKFILSNCRHMFHKECIRETMKRINTCPICRTEINYKDYQRVGFKKSTWDKVLKYTEWLKRALTNLSYPSFENAYKLYLIGLEHIPMGEGIIEQLNSNNPENIYPDFFKIKKGDIYNYKLRSVDGRGEDQTHTARIISVNLIRGYDMVDIEIIDYSYFNLDIKLDNGHSIVVKYVPDNHYTVINGHEESGWNRNVYVYNLGDPSRSYEIIEEEII